MLMLIGIAKSFILSGKLRTIGNFPLDVVLDKNSFAGGNLELLVADIIISAPPSEICGIEFDLNEQDLMEMVGDDYDFSIKELPAGEISIVIKGNQPKKGLEKLTFVFNVNIKSEDEKSKPSMELTMSLSVNQLKNLLPSLKRQFLSENRISELVDIVSLTAFAKANNVLSEAELTDKWSQKTREERWDLVEQSFVREPFLVDIAKKKVITLITVGICITEKLTLSVRFKTKAQNLKKKVETLAEKV